MLATIDERPELASGLDERCGAPSVVSAPLTKHESWCCTPQDHRHAPRQQHEKRELRRMYKSSPPMRMAPHRRPSAESSAWTSSPPTAKQQLRQQLESSRHAASTNAVAASAEYAGAKPSIKDSLLLQLAPEREAALRVRQTRRLSAGSRLLMAQSESDLADMDSFEASCWKRHQRKPRRKDHRKLLHKFTRCLHL